MFGRFAKDFIRRIEGLDLSMQVAFGTWSMEADNGKTYSGVKMYQHGVKVDYTYANEDLPKPTQKKKGSKITWDFSEQEEMLYGVLEVYMTKNFKPNVDDEPDGPPPQSENPAPGRTVEDKAPAKKAPAKKAPAQTDAKKAPAKTGGKEAQEKLPWDEG